MAARRNIAPTIVEQCNVVRLPTAIAKRVQQPTWTRRKAAILAGELHQLPVQYLSTAQWEAKRKEAAKKALLERAGVHRNVELVLVMAVQSVLTDDQKAKVQDMLRVMGGMMPDDVSVQAARSMLGGDA